MNKAFVLGVLGCFFMGTEGLKVKDRHDQIVITGQRCGVCPQSNCWLCPTASNEMKKAKNIAEILQPHFEEIGEENKCIALLRQFYQSTEGNDVRSEMLQNFIDCSPTEE